MKHDIRTATSVLGLSALLACATTNNYTSICQQMQTNHNNICEGKFNLAMAEADLNLRLDNADCRNRELLTRKDAEEMEQCYTKADAAFYTAKKKAEEEKKPCYENLPKIVNGCFQ